MSATKKYLNHTENVMKEKYCDFSFLSGYSKENYIRKIFLYIGKKIYKGIKN